MAKNDTISLSVKVSCGRETSATKRNQKQDTGVNKQTNSLLTVASNRYLCVLAHLRKGRNDLKK